ncbi:MAG: PspC domain-containing protein [Pedobacter sp.]|nr:MAG: PspC domain-containing protein [Pedobacter sp.]
MKRTLNINIGNSIVHIEEDAYEMLTVYLNEVKYHFAKSADNFEIVTDIENRIAEMFAELLATHQKPVIDISDVQSVTQQMGSVKDFETSEESEEIYTNSQFTPIKKLYRDTDQAIVAGVCAGLGHYLDIEDRWIRLIAILTILLGGSGILAYIILWIMIPQAETRSEKMAMRGEEANLRGFANSYLHPFVTRSRGFLAEAFDLLGKFIQGTGKVVVKSFAIFIIIFSSFLLIGLIVSVVALLGVLDSEVVHVFPFSIVNDEYFSVLTFGALLTCAIPLLALILFSVRVAFSNRPINKTFSFVLLILWLTGVGITIFHVAKISSEFKETAEFAQLSDIKPYEEYVLSIDRTRFFSKEDSLRYNIDQGNYKGRKILTNKYDDFEMPRNVRLEIVKSENGKVLMNQNFSAHGVTFEQALRNAQNIHYTFVQQDSLLAFSPSLQLKRSANWRNQEVEMTLKVPVGTKVKISKEFDRYLNGYRYWDCDHDRDSEFTEWVMTEDGIKCQHEVTSSDDE